ncbi:hypothetical protein EBO15_31600 [Actinomadura harenae]|uniref:Tat pathway signal sequence domain protein n=2 Tax=Actinomadura harenae TaxID=2483351 RepID=A0A3M2LN08_9ACTN|nr:hypothetical protein EBO15_31600 [Actinomadura harenae]
MSMRKSLLIASTAAAAATLVAAPATANAATAKTPTKVTFGMSTTWDAKLTISGKVTATNGTVFPAGKWLTAECYSQQQHKWLTVKPGPGQKPLVTRVGGAFSSNLSVYCSHGTYRVRFPGDPTLAPSTSPNVQDKRINALTYGWKVTPRNIRKNGYVYFSGTLKHDPTPGHYVPFKGQQVYLYVKLKGEKSWSWFARPKTDSKGRFSGKFRIPKDAYFTFEYFGDKSHYYDAPLKATFVNVR